MTRTLDTATLDGAARYFAAEFLRPDRPHPRDKARFSGGPSFVMQNFYNFEFKDEFDYMLQRAHEYMGSKAKAEFDALAKKTFTPREDSVFENLLTEKLAITRSGEHKEGHIGSTVLHGMREVGTRLIQVETPESIRRNKLLKLRGEKPGERVLTHREVIEYWPIYAGEPQERIRPGGGVADPLPPGAPGLPVGAFNTRISNVIAILACNAQVDALDEGTGAAILRGYSGAQPAGPDTAASGTLGFTLVCSDPAFGNAVDANPGGRATANAVTDDPAADATITLAYCRASSTNDGATPLDDHIDGEAGLSASDFVFNTLNLVAGAQVGLNSWTYTQPEA